MLVMLGSTIQTYRVTLVQHQVCSQDQQEVVCRCQPGDNQTYLGLRIQGFSRQQNMRQVRLVAALTSPHSIITHKLSWESKM